MNRSRWIALIAVIIFAAGLLYAALVPAGGSLPAGPVSGTVSPAPVGTKPDEIQQKPQHQDNRDPSEYAEHPAAPELTWLKGLEIPPYDGEPYVSLNGGIPFFDTQELRPESYETYYELDALGRCTLADAVVGRDIMPTSKRGNISSVKPTGWHSDRYSFVNGEALYNRCHLIAHYLTGENANRRNLVTGTSYMNRDGMNATENMVGDYVKETGNHVRYRVTPVWTGENLICDGLLVEAWSIEDEGDGICICIFCYNVEPGVEIDYLTGDNRAAGGGEGQTEHAGIPSAASWEKYLKYPDVVGTYIINIKKKKFHLPSCEGARALAEDNREEYTGSRNELVEQGYVPCGSCCP